jgi:hypothetical protein
MLRELLTRLPDDDERRTDRHDIPFGDAHQQSIPRVPVERLLDVTHHRPGTDRSFDDERRTPAIEPASQPEIGKPDRVVVMQVRHQHVIDAGDEFE